jgi:hypothetical protein
MPLMLMQKGAVICGEYRYHLWREWNPDGPRVTFIMLNPSTADSTTEDPTLRRCISFAQSWGFGTLSVVNVFAYRSSSPRDLLTVADPVGPENDAYLANAAARSTCLIAAWGSHGRKLGRERAVMEILNAYTPRLFCLGCNVDGTPRHPLYIRKGTERQCY